MKEVKQILAHGEMSNLVGKWAIIPSEDNRIQYQAFILGSAKKYYIVQLIDCFGTPNICKLVKAKHMKSWIICPTKDIFNDVWRECDNNNGIIHNVRLDGANHKTDY